MILEVHSGKAKLYEVTRISCVPVSDEDSSDFDLEKFKEVRLSSAGDLLTLYHRNGNIYRYSREPSRPAECENYQATDDPEHNFEIFWNTFEENYAFFHIHNVDSHAAYKVYRPRITPETSPEELLEIFGEMVAPLRDYHVSIRTKKKRISHSGYRLRDKVDEVWELVRSKYLKGNYNTRLNQLSYGKLDEKTGYLRIRRMARFTLHHPTTGEETLRLLQQAMDEVLESFQGVEKVILDVRFNGGGSDLPARYFAERFTDRRRLAYAKQARHGDYNEFTPMVEFYIEPKGKSQFTGRVVVLINGASGSATEIFAECVQALPHVTIVGENTEGAFSDNLMKTTSERLGPFSQQRGLLQPRGRVSRRAGSTSAHRSATYTRGPRGRPGPGAGEGDEPLRATTRPKVGSTSNTRRMRCAHRCRRAALHCGLKVDSSA